MSVKSKVSSAARAVAKAFTHESDNPAEVDILDTRDRTARQGAQIDDHECYLEHEWASKTLQRLDSITNVTSRPHLL